MRAEGGKRARRQHQSIKLAVAGCGGNCKFGTTAGQARDKSLPVGTKRGGGGGEIERGLASAGGHLQRRGHG